MAVQQQEGGGGGVLTLPATAQYIGRAVYFDLRICSELNVGAQLKV